VPSQTDQTDRQIEPQAPENKSHLTSSDLSRDLSRSDRSDRSTDPRQDGHGQHGAVTYWPRAISNSPGDRQESAGAVFAHVTIREIVVPAISAGLGDDLLDIDLRWRQ
jgi:hypothetical protein